MARPLDYLNILLVNYNNYEFTIECLESITKAKPSDTFKVRIIIVDNSDTNSSNDSLMSWCKGEHMNIQTNFPDWVNPQNCGLIDHQILNETDIYRNKFRDTYITVIKQYRNDGFAAANNLGINYLMNTSNWNWIWILNNDTVIEPNAIANLGSRLKTIPDTIGIVGTKLFYYDRPDLMQGIGGKYNPYLTTIKHIGSFEKDNGQYDLNYNYEKKVDYPIGASMLVRRSLLEDVGMMNEEYFLFFEELDWTLRAKKAGWQVGFIPSVEVYHKEGGTINRTTESGSSLLSDKCNSVNRIKIAFRFFPLLLPFAVMGALVIIINRIRRRQYDRIIPIFSSLIKLSVR
jgi:GT2 family glycosyltransferase